MRYTYKVRELGPEIPSINEETGGTEVHVNVGEAKEMEAMSLKKLKRKLDPKKKYFIEYRKKRIIMCLQLYLVYNLNNERKNNNYKSKRYHYKTVV